MLEILLDCDGVLSDLHRHLIEILRLDIDPQTPKGYLFKDWVPAEQLKDAYGLMRAPQFWLTLPVIEGSVEGYQRLIDRNSKVTICTAPYHACPMWHDARIQWLKDNFNIRPDDIIFTNKKHLCGSVDRFIDDKLTNIQEFEQRNRNARAYLFTAPHNVAHIRTQRVDWDNIDRIF